MHTSNTPPPPLPHTPRGMLMHTIHTHTHIQKTHIQTSTHRHLRTCTHHLQTDRYQHKHWKERAYTKDGERNAFSNTQTDRARPERRKERRGRHGDNYVLKGSAHTYTHTLTHSFSLSHSPSLSLSLSHMPTLSLSLTLSVCLSHTHTHTHTSTLSLSHWLSLSVSPSLFHPPPPPQPPLLPHTPSSPQTHTHRASHEKECCFLVVECASNMCSVSHGHSTLTPGWPVLALTLKHHAPVWVAAKEPTFGVSLNWTKCGVLLLHQHFLLNISEVHHSGRDFCVCNWFFNPTIGVVTFRLHGWCMLGVFLLLGFTRQGHECQDLWGPWNACVHRLDLGLYSHPKEFGGMKSEPTLTPRVKSLLPEAQRRVEPMTLYYAGQRAKHYRLSYTRPKSELQSPGSPTLQADALLLHHQGGAQTGTERHRWKRQETRLCTDWKPRWTGNTSPQGWGGWAALAGTSSAHLLYSARRTWTGSPSLAHLVKHAHTDENITIDTHKRYLNTEFFYTKRQNIGTEKER